MRLLRAVRDRFGRAVFAAQRLRGDPATARRALEFIAPRSRSMTVSMTQKEEFRREGEHVLVLEPGRAERHYWRDLWAYRELFAILAWRDVAVRYKQTVIGVAWAVVRPFLTMVVFTVVFGRLARLPSEGAAPYPIMVFAGMLPWFLFSSILERGFEQPGRQRQPDRQGLFPAHHHPGLVRGRGAGRFRHQPRHARRADGLVSAMRRAGRSCSCRSSLCWPCSRASARRCSSRRSM